MPDCRIVLVVDETETDDSSIVGDEAHIVAREPDGPRGDSPLTPEERDGFDNLILLCKIHHKVIDDQPNAYTVERLRQIKRDHIEWIQKTPDYDKEKQQDEEVYATYIERWTQLASLNEWNAWTSFIFGGGQPRMSIFRNKQLQELVMYILSRVWSHRYQEFESAFINFALVLTDFLGVFDKYSTNKYQDEWLWTAKFYQIDKWDEDRYNALAEKFDYHVDLVEDLMLELTRAANYVCDVIRKFISPSFRLSEGVLLVTSGPHQDLRFVTHRVEYDPKERIERPYPGLKEFMTVRPSRGTHYGNGYSPDYFPPEFSTE